MSKKVDSGQAIDLYVLAGADSEERIGRYSNIKKLNPFFDLL